MYRQWLSLLLLFLLVPSIVLAQEPTVTLQPTPTLVATSEPQPPSITPQAQPNQVITHRVIAGQTPYTIAALYGITIDDLYRLNNLNDDSILQIGQELIISGVVPLELGVELITDPALLNLPGYPPVPKIHQVQAGDTIYGLAERYGLTAQELQLVNGFTDQTELHLGMTVYIPNQTGDLYARNYLVQIGDSVEAIAARFLTVPEDIIGRNRLLNPSQLIAGQSLRIVSRTGTPDPQQLTGKQHIVGADESLLTIAAQTNTTPQAVAAINHLTWPTPLTAGQSLRIPSGQPYTPLPAGLTALAVSPQPFQQGEAFSIYVESEAGIEPTGRISYSGLITATEAWYSAEYQQTFTFSSYDAGYAAIVGLDAFTQPGLYTLELFLDQSDPPTLSQLVQVESKNYGFQAIALVDDPNLRASEDAVLRTIYASASSQPLWDTSQPFVSPLDNIGYRSAAYGAARSYAGAPVQIFHTGVDYAAPINTPIKAVAAGNVVFSDLTDLRGNVVIIDHGWGVMSGYFHLEQRAVAAGDVVAAGQLIGGLGNTGLSTGAHLHWDLRVNGVAVNGLQWLDHAMPNFVTTASQ